MSTVFSDTFTVGADIGIEAYAAASYDYVQGTTTAVTVNAANDRVQQTTTSADVAVRVINSAVPDTGNGTVSILQASTLDADNVGNPACRFKNDGTAYYYVLYIYRASGTPSNNVKIYRVENSSFNMIAQFTRASIGVSTTATLKGTTNGSAVDIVGTISGVTDCTYSDTGPTRLLEGRPGFHMYCETANAAWIDNLSVDDVGAETTPITVNNLTVDNLAGGEIV